MVGPPGFEPGTSCTPTKKRLHAPPPHVENKAVAVLDLRELCGNFAGFGDFAGIVRDEKPRLDGVGGIPNGTAKRHREVVTSTEDFDLDRRLESIEATAIKFVQDMDETIIVDGGIPNRRTSRVWSDEDDGDRATV